MSQRLSRKEIKRDEFMESVGEAIEYVRGHSRGLASILVAVVVAALIGALVYGYLERRGRQADEALARALQIRQAAIDPVASDPESRTAPSFPDVPTRALRTRELLEAVRQDYSRSDAAGIAAVYLGQLAVEEGDLTTARALWEEYSSTSSDHMLAAEVRCNLMGLDRTEGKGEELVSRLRGMLSGADEGLPHDLLWYQLALTLDDLGRQAEATEAYRRIVEDFPQSAYSPEARVRAGDGGAPLLSP